MKIRCFCSTTEQTFMAAAQWYVRVGTRTFAWVYCPYCDDHRRTARDADYDPRAPQPHCQPVDAALLRTNDDKEHSSADYVAQWPDDQKAQRRQADPRRRASEQPSDYRSLLSRAAA